MSFTALAIRVLNLCLIAGLALFIVAPLPARAQSLEASVNGDPVTNLDLEQRIKLLRSLKKPASKDDALESLVADRLKFHEAHRFGIDASEDEMSAIAAKMATTLKMQPSALIQAWQRAGIDGDHYRNYLRALAAWNTYVRALNKTLGVSEREISAEIARLGDKAHSGTEFTVRPIVFVVPGAATPALYQQRLREAEGLRNRFEDCAQGLQLAKGLPDVAIKESVTRNASSLVDNLRQILERTPKGKLTPPERSAAGIEMLAVCEKANSRDDTSLREQIQTELLASRLEGQSQSLYRELRARAVIEKR